MSHYIVMVFENDPEDQLAPYDENLEGCQNPKWDWYVLGGRWHGFFKAKDPSKIVNDLSGIFDEEIENGYGDAMEKGNIDIKGMEDEYIKECLEEYDEIVGIINHWIETNTKNGNVPSPKPWSYYQNLVDNHILTLDEAKDLYEKKESYINLLKDAGYVFWRDDPIADYWAKTREEYLSDSLKHFMLPYAFVINGEWHALGEMGWFGFSYSENDFDTYYKEFWDTFNSLPDDTLVSLFDCHI